MSISSALLEFVRKELLGGRNPDIDDATPLLSQGVIDSIGLTQILAFIEKQAGVKVPDDEVAPENFETIRAIDDMVTRLGREGASRR